MDIKYEIISIKNAGGTGEEHKFVRLQQPVMLTEKEVEEEIEHSCTLTVSDLKGVFSALRKLIVRELSYGNRVYIPEIGYFTVAAELNAQKNGELNDSKDGELNDSKDNAESDDGKEHKITGKDVFFSGINFRPTKAIYKDVESQVHFVKSNLTTKSANYEKEALWQQIEDYLKEHRFITAHRMRDEFALSRYKAEKWLKLFVEEGKLVKDGSWKSPTYFLA